MIETIENRHWDFSLLPPDALVYDLGALHGNFSKLMASKGYRVVAFEPDELAFSTIPKTPLVTGVNKGIGFPSGRRNFFQFTPGSGANGLYKNEFEEKVHAPKEVEVDIITLQEAVDTYGLPSLVKMNIEGSEIDIIMNSSDDLLQSIPQYTISFHAFCGFITKDTEDVAKQRIRDLGFELHFFDSPELPQDCWAVRG
jgi:FkbM family methyltransferase